jgi:WYL domain
MSAPVFTTTAQEQGCSARETATPKSSCPSRDRNRPRLLRNTPAPGRGWSRTLRNKPATQRNRFTIRCAIRVLAQRGSLITLWSLGLRRPYELQARHSAASRRTITTGTSSRAGLRKVPRAEAWPSAAPAPRTPLKSSPSAPCTSPLASHVLLTVIDRAVGDFTRRWLLSFGPEVEVLEPESLRHEIAGDLRKAAGVDGAPPPLQRED